MPGGRSGLAAQELELQPNRAGRHDPVGHARRDGLGGAGVEMQQGFRVDVRFELEVDLAFEDVQAAPPPTRGAVGAPEAVGKGILVPGPSVPYDGEAVREFGALAERTVDGRSDTARPSFGIEHPGSRMERGKVTDMLVVEARELRYPAIMAVGVEARDGPDHQSAPSGSAGSGRVTDIAPSARSSTHSKAQPPVG